MPTKRERIGSEQDDLVRQYLAEIGQHKLLKKADETRLAQEIEAGVAAAEQLEADKPRRNSNKYRELHRLVRRGERARSTFVNANLRLVVSIAKKYTGKGMELMDLIQEGNLGMMHAVDKFDWRKGFKFSTYATWWIKQALDRALANKARSIRLPVHVGTDLRHIRKARAQLIEQLGREPSLGEIAGKLDWSRSKVEDLLLHAQGISSLNQEIGEDGEAELGDMFGVDVDFLPGPDASERLSELMEKANLGPLEIEFLSLRYDPNLETPRSYQELVAWFGGNRESLRRWHGTIVDKLRRTASSLALDDEDV